MAAVKKHLSFRALRDTACARFNSIEDHRSSPVVYSINDCLMSAFAMMFFQDPSLLAFQRRMQDELQESNLVNIFGVKNIPADTQLRDTIDKVDPGWIEPIFADYFRRLQRGKHTNDFGVLGDHYFVVLDASQYFASEKIRCPGCLSQKPSSGKTLYSHQILQAAMVAPHMRQVIPLAPEPIKNEDGTIKQDCEINASKRMLRKIRADHPRLKIIIGGDSLYSKQPFIDELKAVGMSFALVAKPGDHKVLFEWVSELREMGELSVSETKDVKGYTHRYEWTNGVALNGRHDGEIVNFIEYSMIRKDGKTTYHNSWVTDIEVEDGNVVELVRLGRARWKIENECFNTLKNHGYHIEHNYGHGKKNLSYNFFLLNLLAYFCHQIFELTDRTYMDARQKFSSRAGYWQMLKYSIQIILVKDWEHLLRTLVEKPHIHAPP